MDQVISSFAAAKRLYDDGSPSLVSCFSVVDTCLRLLVAEAQIGAFGRFSGKPHIHYAAGKAGANLSRPFRPELFEGSPARFSQLATEYLDAMNGAGTLPADVVNRTVYTAITAFSVCFDLWRPKSRKTPGTFFEVFVGSTCRLRFPDYELTKHIAIGDPSVPSDEDLAPIEDSEGREEERAVHGNFVSTDLVIRRPDADRGAVVPLKITTRERIVQPFAHQRILDSAYPGRYASFIACISEVQRDDKTETVKQICVPGTIALFQKHLAKVAGLYYCDVPQRYSRQDFTQLIPVRDFHHIFGDIANWLE